MMTIILANGGNHEFLKNMQRLMTHETMLVKPKRAKIIPRGAHVIRYGSAKVLGNDITVINPAKAIEAAGNKRNARLTLLRNDIPVPALHDYQTLSATLKKDYPVIVRPIRHMAGRHFYYCKNIQDVSFAISRIRVKTNEECYISEFIDKDREYRVHCAHGKCLAVQEKERDYIYNTNKPPAWNHKNGYRFEVLQWSKIPKGLCPLACKSVASLNLDFGAVDIIEKDGKFYVLEVNTAPRIEGYIADRYGIYFDWLIDNGLARPWFNDVSKYIIRDEDLN